MAEITENAFIKAHSDNLLNINPFILLEFIHSNDCFNSPEIKRVKAESSGLHNAHNQTGDGLKSLFTFSDNYLHNALTVESTLTDRNTNKTYIITISAFEGSIFRFKINDPVSPREEYGHVLNNPSPAAIAVMQLQYGIRILSGDSEAILHYEPFMISIYKNNALVLLVNDHNRMIYNSKADDRSIAVDFTFTDATTTYGIPLHAERLELQSTTPGKLDPYIMFNVDHCCYDNFIQDSLYAAVPVLYGHSINRTAAVFWLNAAQTFVDINREDNQVQTLFIAEDGIMDFFVLTGPTFDDVARQYTYLTGTAPLQQYFTLGYHQSRWSYMDQEDVLTVLREFDNHDFPLETLWLDVDYMSASKSFTWNYTSFPDLVGMQGLMASTGRRLILIIDPHFGVQEGYFVYDEASINNYFVKYPNGSDFRGIGWPGTSSWLDFLNPNASTYFASLYSKENFPSTTENVYIWNDMNEPEVFDGFERSWPRYVLHHRNLTNREVHNIYSLAQVKATYYGLLARYNNMKRPYILSRSHFAGSQRYSIAWTGDNNSSWSHLQISFPMCLSMAIAGISNCGADIGGFAGNLSDELFQRWYQAGAWLPFYRGHSTRYVKRREPYLFSDETQARIRNAIRQRYYYLPLWYTLFYEHERYGRPVIRPLVYHYPNDGTTHDIDDQWLVGSDILVHPVYPVYFPGGIDEKWYDIDNNLMYFGIGYEMVCVTMDSTPVYHKGGSIIARREVHRRATDYMHSDPYSIYIFLNKIGGALGTLYIDDNETFDYRNDVYNYYRLQYNGTSLHILKIDPNAEYTLGLFTINRIFIYGSPTYYQEVVIEGGKIYNVSYGPDQGYLIADNLDIAVYKQIFIKFM